MPEQLAIWDGRYASVRPEVNAGRLPEARFRIWSARVALDNALAALATITVRGPGWQHAARDLATAASELSLAIGIANAEALAMPALHAPDAETLSVAGQPPNPGSFR